MEFIKPGTYIDFMKYRVPVITVLGIMATLSLVSLFYPGPNYGIDFAGGTEVQLLFKSETSPAEVRQALQESGYARPDVISVEDQPNEYIIRVQEVSSLPDAQVEKIRASVAVALGDGVLQEMKVSPGGDKITIRVSGPVNEQQLQEALMTGGANVRSINALTGSRDPRYEAQLVGVADELHELDGHGRQDRQLRARQYFVDNGGVHLSRTARDPPRAGRGSGWCRVDKPRRLLLR